MLKYRLLIPKRLIFPPSVHNKLASFRNIAPCVSVCDEQHHKIGKTEFSLVTHAHNKGYAKKFTDSLSTFAPLLVFLSYFTTRQGRGSDSTKKSVHVTDVMWRDVRQACSGTCLNSTCFETVRPNSRRPAHKSTLRHSYVWAKDMRNPRLSLASSEWKWKRRLVAPGW
jgi:hypothetical protein